MLKLLRLIVLISACAVPPGAAMAANEVDLELVLAVDISYSMDEEEQTLQRIGYAEAITAPEVLEAIARGRWKRITVAYVEWAGSAYQDTVIDWTLIDDETSARRFAEQLLLHPTRRIQRTSISGGLLHAQAQFARNAYRGERRVIDVSGDGANNQGPLVTVVRDQVVAAGTTINGLPILINPSASSTYDVARLDLYYEDCVIGGEGAFMVPIQTLADFRAATRHKLLMEVAGIHPPPRLMPALASAPPCDIGEKMWRERQGMAN